MWQRFVSKLGVVALAFGMFFVPQSAHAETKRLEIFMNYGEQIYHHWSDDGGTTWSQWLLVPPAALFYGNSLSFVGQPAVISPSEGVIRIVARTNQGFLVENDYLTDDVGNTYWWGWYTIGGSRQGGVCIDNKGCWTWLPNSYPALSSWGANRAELFMNARRSDGTIGLLHTWWDDGWWSDRWELLGTGGMQGSPTAVSWGPGRTDVFVRGGGGELSHKWFDNGSWSSGWDDLGGYQTASPAVISPYVGQLEVFVRGGDGALWYRSLNQFWSNWQSLGGVMGEGTSPTAVIGSWGVHNVFVTGADGVSLYQNDYRGPYYGYGWTGFMLREYYLVAPAALAWRPSPGQPEY